MVLAGDRAAVAQRIAWGAEYTRIAPVLTVAYTRVFT